MNFSYTALVSRWLRRYPPLLRGMLAVRVSSISHLSFAHILRVGVFGQLSFMSLAMDCGRTTDYQSNTCLSCKIVRSSHLKFTSSNIKLYRFFHRKVSQHRLLTSLSASFNPAVLKVSRALLPLPLKHVRRQPVII